MTAFETLLDLQAHDVRLDQLRHQRAHLPERAELAAMSTERESLGARVAAVRAERDVVAREQKRLEDEVALVAAKVTAEDKRLYSGTVSAMKELQSLQDEIASLTRRRNTLEDAVLAQMELAEPLDAVLTELQPKIDDLAARVGDVEGRLAAAKGVIDAEATGLQAERDELAAHVDPELLRQYEELRKRLGGVAVARLEGNSCRGCHLHLAAVEIERIRKLDRDAVVHCEECGRILVR